MFEISECVYRMHSDLNSLLQMFAWSQTHSGSVNCSYSIFLYNAYFTLHTNIRCILLARVFVRVYTYINVHHLVLVQISIPPHFVIDISVNEANCGCCYVTCL